MGQLPAGLKKKAVKRRRSLTAMDLQLAELDSITAATSPRPSPASKDRQEIPAPASPSNTQGQGANGELTGLSLQVAVLSAVAAPLGHAAADLIHALENEVGGVVSRSKSG